MSNIKWEDIWRQCQTCRAFSTIKLNENNHYCWCPTKYCQLSHEPNATTIAALNEDK